MAATGCSKLISTILLIAALQVKSSCAHLSEYSGTDRNCWEHPWLIPIPGSNGSCECGSDLGGVVKCSNVTREVTLRGCHCMSYSEALNTTVVGECLYTCGVEAYPVASDRENLDEVCKPFNREGFMCRNCKKGFGVSLTGYNVTCTNCSDSVAIRVMKSIGMVFLPLTLLYLAVIVFSINVTSPPMNSFVFVCQYMYLLNLEALARKQIIAFWIINSLYSISGLDTIFTLSVPVCLDIRLARWEMSLIYTYVTCLYPILLIMITYGLVKLHERNIRVIVWMWRPVHKCFSRFRRQWHIKASLIKVFATFLVLSYTKYLLIFSVLMVPVKLYGVSGEGRLYYFLDPAMDYFCPRHLLFMTLVVVTLLIFSILPFLLLCLYPCRCFQRMLNCCHLRCQALHIFMDVFQGHFKDGTNGTRDYRFFSGAFLLVRLVMCAGAVADIFMVGTVGAFAIIILCVCVIAFQPYKSARHNSSEALFLLIPVCYVLLSAARNRQVPRSTLNPLFSIGQVAVAVAPLVCLIAYYLFIESKYVVKCFQWMWTKIKAITARKQNSDIIELDSFSNYNMMRSFNDDTL